KIPTAPPPPPPPPLLPPDGITGKEIEALTDKLTSDDPRIMNEARDELKEVGKPAVPYLMMTLVLEKTRSDVRYLICEILGEVRDERSKETLIKLLNDKEEHTASIASAAARALGKLGDISVIPHLIDTLKSNTTDIELRYECIRTLGILRAHQALPFLRPAITDTARTFLGYYVKAIAVQALGKLKDTQSVKHLIPLLKDTDIEPATDEPFVKYVVKALEQITNYPAGSFVRTDDKKKEAVIKKWEEWWQKNKKDYE
ncbi:MAG: HEAT repeat domain-containing protein, partial [Planctomycetota bacterium]|nr:HEAT repeat domain-containing protein [Planctomycetota bacterium]